MNLKLLDQLIHFDDRLMDFVVGPLEIHRDQLVKAKVHERLHPNNLIQVFKNIRSNQSLKAYYQAMHNQWLVLLVSYFGSAVRDLFVEAVTLAIKDRTRPAILRAVLEAHIEELADEHGNLPAFLADLLSSKKDISFQDMQSIGRAFSEYFGVTIERDDTVNDIVAAQACRHAIVHSGGVVDRRLVSQVRGARPRSLKPDLKNGETLTFSPAEIERASTSMRDYLHLLDTKIAVGDMSAAE